MRILVLGSGVIGITTAWYLLERGHDVVIIDRVEESVERSGFTGTGRTGHEHESLVAAHDAFDDAELAGA